MEVETLYVDVMGTFNADDNGYCNMGTIVHLLQSIICVAIFFQIDRLECSLE